jgi:hypothetical protein
VRFKYREAPALDFGFTTDEILNMTDKELNQKVSIKKYALYRLCGVVYTSTLSKTQSHRTHTTPQGRQ